MNGKHDQSVFDTLTGSPGIAEEVARRAGETARKTQLRRMRKAAGLTQHELARAAGWSQPYVSRLERFDGREPTLDVVEKWAHACGFEGEARFFRRGPGDSVEEVAALAI